jgi:mRNA-degrading endonuclease YafQ of YafQ-DinJ toxin-antitoxin module
MTNYENDIMEILQGDTPRQKYDFLVEILKMHKQHDDPIEAALLTVCNKLENQGNEMHALQGADSYTERCHLHDAKILIYGLTNKSKIEKMNYIKWREEVQANLD